MARDTNFHNSVIGHLKEVNKRIKAGSTQETDLEILTILTNSQDSLSEVKDALAGEERPIYVVEAIRDGETDAGVQSVSLLFIGDNGKLNGVEVQSKTSFYFAPNKGEDTVSNISYIVPTTGEQRIIISYVA